MQKPTSVRAVSAEEFKTIYAWMEKQFHAGELKYPSHIEKMRADGRYEIYGLWNRQTLIAYALFAFAKDKRFALLDYYAVLPEYQAAGWGSTFLKELQKTVPCEAILLEVEDPKYAPDAAEKAHFARRIRFYERNDCLHTPVNLNLWGFDYIIMTLPIQETPSPKEIHASLEDLYHLFFTNGEYEENVHFREDENDENGGK